MSGIVAQPEGITYPPIDAAVDEKPLAIALREIDEGLLTLESAPQA